MVLFACLNKEFYQMTQRNPMNERYQSEERTGKTRKSASAAKPTSKAGATTRDPLPKTKKEKKAEARERERKEMEKARELGVSSENMPTVQYRNLRRQYWACLIGAIVCTALSFMFTNMSEPWSNYSMWCLILAYVLIIMALYIDLSKIRKLRKGYTQEVARGKSKAARREQKARAAEKRAQQKEAAAAYAAAKENQAAQANKSLGERLKDRFSSKPKQAKDDLQQKAEAVKADQAAKPAPKKIDKPDSAVEGQADAAKADSAAGESADK